MVDKKFFQHELSIVAVIKNEAAYLEEWLNYHLAAGVDHFYLYDNEQHRRDRRNFRAVH